MKDIFGKAIKDYYFNKDSAEDIVTWTNISDKDILPVDYLFRSYKKMPGLEQEALDLCRGKILDVGCGAGSHSLYLQENGFSVKAIDISKGAVEITKKRGIKNVEHKDILEVNSTFDTILLMMNGTGIFQKYDMVTTYLKHLKTLLNPEGQILIDSSDIRYMYDGDEDIMSLNRYYGELDYFLSYKEDYEMPITWLYLDFESLKQASKQAGLICQKISNGKHYDYLARLSKPI